MNIKTVFLKDLKDANDVQTSLMVMKKLYSDNNKYVCILGDKTGDIKATVPVTNEKIEIGQVLEVKGKKDLALEVIEFTVIKDFNIEDYLPVVKRPIEEIMEEIEKLTQENITSEQAIELNNFFFKDEEFVSKLKKVSAEFPCTIIISAALQNIH